MIALRAPVSMGRARAAGGRLFFFRGARRNETASVWRHRQARFAIEHEQLSGRNLHSRLSYGTVRGYE